MFSIKYYLLRKKKILNGFKRKLLSNTVKYDINTFWDEVFYKGEISDRNTIDLNWNQLSALHHYASLELLILEYFYNNKIDLNGQRLLDIGSGAGHWIKFYKHVGCADCVGTEISGNACKYLKEIYKDDSSIAIYQESFQDYLKREEKSFNIVNAIGVMFHVVDNNEWNEGIRLVSNALESGGLFLIGGHFGILNNIDVQVDEQGKSNKRLRSGKYWKRVLKENGFKDIRILKNRNAFYIEDFQPENNLLVAVKR